MQVSEMAEKGAKEVKKSGEDWLEYVETHPIQSMLFGVVIFYAFKGLFK